LTTPATAADQIAASVRQWLNQRVQDSGREAPANLYLDLLHCVEPALLDEVMRRVHGNRWVAAQWLGLNRATVRKKLKLYNLANTDRPEDEDDEAE
jgi:Fis family transcriptional regulator